MMKPEELNWELSIAPRDGRPGGSIQVKMRLPGLSTEHVNAAAQAAAQVLGATVLPATARALGTVSQQDNVSQPPRNITPSSPIRVRRFVRRHRHWITSTFDRDEVFRPVPPPARSKLIVTPLDVARTVTRLYVPRRPDESPWDFAETKSKRTNPKEEAEKDARIADRLFYGPLEKLQQNMERLEAQSCPVEERFKLTKKAQAASVQALYYNDMNDRANRKALLESQYLPSNKETRLDKAQQSLMAKRLHDCSMEHQKETLEKLRAQYLPEQPRRFRCTKASQNPRSPKSPS